jgi:hypothetical protein
VHLGKPTPEILKITHTECDGDCAKGFSREGQLKRIALNQWGGEKPSSAPSLQHRQAKVTSDDLTAASLKQRKEIACAGAQIEHRPSAGRNMPDHESLPKMVNSTTEHGVRDIVPPSDSAKHTLHIATDNSGVG